jgi:hypothetical protein
VSVPAMVNDGDLRHDSASLWLAKGKPPPLRHAAFNGAVAIALSD